MDFAGSVEINCVAPPLNVIVVFTLVIPETTVVVSPVLNEPVAGSNAVLSIYAHSTFSDPSSSQAAPLKSPAVSMPTLLGKLMSSLHWYRKYKHQVRRRLRLFGLHMH